MFDVSMDEKAVFASCRYCGTVVYDQQAYMLRDKNLRLLTKYCDHRYGTPLRQRRNACDNFKWP